MPTPPTVIYVPIPTQAGTPTQVATAPQPPVTLDVTGLVLTPATTVGHRRRTTTRAKLVFVASALNLPDTGQTTWRGPATGQGVLTLRKTGAAATKLLKPTRPRRTVETTIPVRATEPSYNEATAVLTLTVTGNCAKSGTLTLSTSQTHLQLCGTTATWQVPAQITAEKERRSPA